MALPSSRASPFASGAIPHRLVSREVKRPATVQIAAPLLRASFPTALSSFSPSLFEGTNFHISTGSKMRGTSPKNSDGG
ncbi:hypothetical protein SETIT_5G159600v2 [Setaria italica]|uniref:Uncharacterized protein n=2 Tax=Setaria TaxID=4554 RepID=A0A368R5D7_SETIT|nr:hypothetical protein SETIT_5G159600v2 [Setaria italica]